MDIKEIVAANKLRQQEAVRLNIRAGECIFQVLSVTQLAVWYAERLGRARRLAEIVNWESLRLPELDSGLVRKVLTENPDTINVLGREVPVQYSSSHRNPFIFMNFQSEKLFDWTKIPKEGIMLPSNREVTLYASTEGCSIELPSSKFVEGAREILNSRQWERFLVSANKPTITTPDTASITAQIPEVCEHQYGTCVVTQSPLVGFGVVTHTTDYWYVKRFEVRWYNSRDEAESERTKAVHALTTIQLELLEKLQRESGNIREITIDRRGEFRKPELNGQRIDNRSAYELTPGYFWTDLLDLVEEFGRGQKAFAIYRGDSPLLVYHSRELIERVLPQVQNLIQTLGVDYTSQGRENFLRKLEEFRTQETKKVERPDARQNVEHKRTEAAKPKVVSAGVNSFGDAFAQLGL